MRSEGGETSTPGRILELSKKSEGSEREWSKIHFNLTPPTPNPLSQLEGSEREWNYNHYGRHSTHPVIRTVCEAIAHLSSRDHGKPSLRDVQNIVSGMQ